MRVQAPTEELARMLAGRSQGSPGVFRGLKGEAGYKEGLFWTRGRGATRCAKMAHLGVNKDPRPVSQR